MSNNTFNRAIFGPHNHPRSLDSGNTPEEFIRSAAVDFGRKAIAITDHGDMGAIIQLDEFSKILAQKGIDIKVVPGLEAYVLPAEWDTAKTYYHITLHFPNTAAYVEASKLSRNSADRAVMKGGEYKNLMTWEELKSLSGKVVISSGCMVSPVGRNFVNNNSENSERYFKELQQIAGEGKFFAEVFPYEVAKSWVKSDKKTGAEGYFKANAPSDCCPDGRLQVSLNNWIFHLAKKYKVPEIISEDAHFAKEDQKIIQDIRINKTGQKNWIMSDANCLHTTEWLYNEFKRIHPDVVNDTVFNNWIDNGEKMLEHYKGIDLRFKPNLPRIVVDRSELKKLDIDVGINNEGKETVTLQTDDDYVTYTMAKLVDNGRIDFSNSIYSDRINRELAALYYNGQVNLAPYMLFLTKVVDWCKKNDVLVGPGRGSAAGCLISYGLGITQVDPIKEDLLFERFFDASRVSEGLADIDMDFSDREKVTDWLQQEFGSKFSFLGTFSNFKTKTVLKDIDRFLNGVVSPEVENVCKYVDTNPTADEVQFLLGYTDSDGVHHEGEIDKNKQLRDFLNTHPKHNEYLFQLAGICRQMGVHAAGVIISEDDVQDFIPMTKVAKKTVTAVQPKYIEKLGGIKFDILGLSTLMDIQKTLTLVKTRHDVDLDPWDLPNDQRCWDELVKDQSAIFQLHTVTVKPGVIGMRPNSIQQASILTALYRPGAMDAPSEYPGLTMEKVFIKRWNKELPVKYIHDDLKNYIGETAGVYVFQEQAMKTVHELGGLTMAETNQFRKAISKKNSDALNKLLAKVKINLINDRNWSEDQVNLLVDQLKASGLYSFNKSHSVAYCYIAYACLFLRTYFPMEYWSSVLSNASKEDLIEFWNFQKKIVELPRLNQSTDRFEIIKKIENGVEIEKLLAPISLIQGLGEKTEEKLLAERPYVSLEDLIKRSGANRKVLYSLALSGLVDDFFKLDDTVYDKLNALEEAISTAKKIKKVAVSSEYLNTTLLKEYLTQKKVFKAFIGDVDGATESYLSEYESEYSNIMSITSGVMIFNVDNRQYILKKSKTFLNEKESSGNYAYPCLIKSSKEKVFFHEGKKKTMLTLEVDIGDKTVDMAMFPKWGKVHYNEPEMTERKFKDTFGLIFLYYKGGGKYSVTDFLNLNNGDKIDFKRKSGHEDDIVIELEQDISVDDLDYKEV